MLFDPATKSARKLFRALAEDRRDTVLVQTKEMVMAPADVMRILAGVDATRFAEAAARGPVISPSMEAGSLA